MLRLVVPYLLSLAGVGTSLVEAGLIVNVLLRWVLGSAQTFTSILQATSLSLSILVPMGGVWAYYGRQLRTDFEQLPEQPRRAGLNRFYTYILAALGLGATIFGLQQLLSFIVNAAVTQQIGSDALRNQLSAAVSALIVGIPLWWRTWRPMQYEANRIDDSGDYARRSVVRKAYLYLALFASVVGVMAGAGEAIYLLISSVMGTPVLNLVQSVLNALQTMVLFALWLAYHLRVLRQDGHLADQALARLHGQYPVLVIDTGNGFGEEIMGAMRRFAPEIPVTRWAINQELPETAEPGIKAVVLPSFLVAQPPETLRTWLERHPGMRLVVPSYQESWEWVGTIPRTNRERAQQAAQAIRQMAEGQPVRISPPVTPWAIAGFVLGGLFALELLLVLVALVVSTLQR